MAYEKQRYILTAVIILQYPKRTFAVKQKAVKRQHTNRTKQSKAKFEIAFDKKQELSKKRTKGIYTGCYE